VASIGVLMIFLVPAGSGPFSAVHGPVTARRCQRAADRIFHTMSLSAEQAEAFSAAEPADPESAAYPSPYEDAEDIPPGSLSMLRC